MPHQRPRIFVPLWHPPEDATSGGLYRAKRTLELMRRFDLDIVDSDSSRLDAILVQGRVRTYPSRLLASSARRWFRPARIANYAWSLVNLVVSGLRGGAYDLVYVPTSELPHVALAGWLVGRIKRVPVIFCNLNVRGTDLWLANRFLHRNVFAVLTISRALAEELRAEGVREPILIGSCGIDDESIAQRPDPDYAAIFVGRHVASKGVFDLVDIWRRVRERIPSARLLMIGPANPAEDTELKKAIDRAKLTDAIDVRGAVSTSNKWRAYANARVCVFPSHIEGWGIVPIEAHAAGLPVVAYDLPAYEETIRASDFATLTPLGDTDAFADAVVELLERADAKTSPKAWAARFTWDRATQLEEMLITQALERDADSAYAQATTDKSGDNAQKDGAFARRMIEALAAQGPLGAFLDLGCGTGSVLDAARPFATSLTGVDSSQVFLTQAARAIPEARLIVSDVAAVPEVADGSFESATFCDVIEHLENPVAALREIRRMLKPNGNLLVSTPNSDSIFRRLLGPRWFALRDRTHIIFYSRFSLTTLLDRSGFEVVSHRTFSEPATRGLRSLIERTGNGGTLVIMARRRHD